MNPTTRTAKPVTAPVQSLQAVPSGASARARQRRVERFKLYVGLFATDLAVLVVAFSLAFGARLIVGAEMDRGAFLIVTGALLPLYLLLYHFHGLYQTTNLFGGSGEYQRVFGATTAGLLLVLSASALYEPFRPGPKWLLLFWALALMGGLFGRFVARRVVYLSRRRGMFVERTLVLGANPEGIAVAQQLSQNSASCARIVGFVDDLRKPAEEPLPGMPVLGGRTDFARLVLEHEIDAVVVADPSILRKSLLSDESALATLRDVEVQVAWGAFELLTTGLRIREEGFVPLVVLNKTRISGVHWLLKMLLDRVCSLLALVALSPLFLVLAILIRLDSKGPVFHRRRVVGVGRREFDAFKFRTMRVEGDALLTEDQKREWEESGKIKDDPRVTKLGAFLRRYSFDELPQLLNVLRGEMSIVGPRMLTMAELEKFGPWQHSLLTVKPGLTGLWQISGRSDLSYEDRVRLDMHYIRNHTIWLDLQILVQTFPALLSGRGAY